MSEPAKQAAAVLLCGGESERLGFPKEMLRVGGEPLALRMVRKLRGIFSRVVVSSNHPGYLDYLLDVPICEDEVRDAGPLGGILVAMRRAEGRPMVVVPCDMPGVAPEALGELARRAARGGARALVAEPGGPLLCAVCDRAVAGEIQRFLEAGGRSAKAFWERLGHERVSLPCPEPWRFRDVDSPSDLWLVEREYGEVEPLPVREVQLKRPGQGGTERDFVPREEPFAVYVNQVKVATILCLPNAVRELAAGFASYLGLARGGEELLSIGVGYDDGRVHMEVEAPDERVRGAVRMLVTSTCGATIYGGELQETSRLEGARWKVKSGRLLERIRELRHMAPVFQRTGGTHQAAFTDGGRILYFYEDVGRHNALDKVIGRAVLEGRPLGEGALIATGRISSEMAMKALRQGVPVIASRSAVTSHALRLAEENGLTVVGFARGSGLNVYTHPERIVTD